MSDDLHDNNSADKDKPEDSASAIFAAIMREAAEKAKPRSARAAKEETPLSPQESSIGQTTDAAEEADASSIDDTELKREQETAAAPAVSDEQQRIRRIPRRQLRRRPGTGGAFGGFIRTLFVVCISTGLVATLLTWFTSPEFLNPAVVQGLQLNDELLFAGVAGSYSTPTPLRRQNGIIASASFPGITAEIPARSAKTDSAMRICWNRMSISRLPNVSWQT